MHIQSVNNNVNSKGLYFIKSPNVIYSRNPGTNYVTKDVVGYSERGYKYIKDLRISQEMKDRFHFIPFIMNLLKTGDAFVFFREVSKAVPDNITDSYLSFAKIFWLDTKVGEERCRTVYGNSDTSQEEATQDMMEHLINNDFAELKIR